MSAPTGPDDRDLAAVARLLKRQLDERELDTSRVTRSVMDQISAAPPPARPPGVRRRALVRRVGTAAAVAGVVAAVVVGALALRPDGGSITPVLPATPSPTGPSTGPTLDTPTASATSSPPAPSSSSPAPAPDDPTSPRTGSTTPTGDGAATPGAAPAPVVAVSEPADLSLSVSGGSTDDFVVAGVDAADPFVTARRDGSPQVVSSGAVGDPRAAVETGAFVTSWDGGEAPYESGTAAEWFVVRPAPGGPDSGVVVQVAGASAGDRVVVHVGVAGPRGRVEVVVDGEVADTQPLTGGGAGAVPYVLTVTMPDPPVDTVGLRVLAPDGGAVGLAAAQLNPS